MGYVQSLYKVERHHLKERWVKKDNRWAKFKTGYNEDLNCVVISTNGTIGDIYVIQGLRIAIPEEPKECTASSNKQKEQVF